MSDVFQRTEAYVQAVHRERREALLSSGAIVPITHMFDLNGDETDDVDMALTFTCGSAEHGWFCDYFEHFKGGMH